MGTLDTQTGEAKAVTRYFHLYADLKTIREISSQEYFRLSNRADRRFLVCAVDKWGYGFVRGPHVVFVPAVQLKQVMEAAEK